MLKRLLAALALLSAAFSAHAQEADPIRIEVDANGREDWSVVYRLATPAERLVFPRSPDASRAEDWRADPAFEIVSHEDGEVLRRRDGAAFSEAEVRIAPLYRELPMDYAPFSPFGDGGMLVYTGRLFACAEACAGDESWDFSLTAGEDHNVLVNGEVHERSAAWRDGGQGANVYVGPARPAASATGLAVIDQALPAVIQTQLAAELPRFMDYFAARLGELDSPPMLFASWDTSIGDGGYGRQGGTLPGQVFIHFYGAWWAQEMARGGFADGLSWHFAHEAAHLYQRQLFTTAREGAWIHEGGAEALAALALSDGGPERASAVAEIVEAARTECAERLAGRSIRQAITSGDTRVPYVCGLQVNLALHDALLRQRPDQDGLYAVWRAYIRRAQGAEEVTEGHFLAAIAEVSGRDLAEAVARAVDDPAFDRGALVF